MVQMMVEIFVDLV